MERLTVRDKTGIILCPMSCTKECVPALCSRCKHQIAAFNRLAEYEDTGLTPEEIAVLMDRTAKKIMDAVAENIPSLVQTISENMPRLIDKVADKIHLQLHPAPMRWIENGPSSQCPKCGFSCNDEYYLGNGNFCPECGQPLTGLCGREG